MWLQRQTRAQQSTFRSWSSVGWALLYLFVFFFGTWSASVPSTTMALFCSPSLGITLPFFLRLGFSGVKGKSGLLAPPDFLFLGVLNFVWSRSHFLRSTCPLHKYDHHACHFGSCKTECQRPSTSNLKALICSDRFGMSRSRLAGPTRLAAACRKETSTPQFPSLMTSMQTRPSTSSKSLAMSALFRILVSTWSASNLTLALNNASSKPSSLCSRSESLAVSMSVWCLSHLAEVVEASGNSHSCHAGIQCWHSLMSFANWKSALHRTAMVVTPSWSLSGFSNARPSGRTVFKNSNISSTFRWPATTPFRFIG